MIKPLAFVVVVAAAVGCGGASRPPPPPAYTPVNSPEAESPCPEQWQAAKTAREELVGETAPAARIEAARAVFAQAECERARLRETPSPQGTQADVIDALRSQRQAMQNLSNLYEEVARYHTPGFALALGRIGELALEFSQRLTSTSPPTDLGDPNERLEFRTELKTLSETFLQEAAVRFEAALAAAAEDGEATAEWASSLCGELRRLNTLAWDRQPLCVSGSPLRGNE